MNESPSRLGRSRQYTTSEHDKTAAATFFKVHCTRIGTSMNYQKKRRVPSIVCCHTKTTKRNAPVPVAVASVAVAVAVAGGFKFGKI